MGPAMVSCRTPRQTRGRGKNRRIGDLLSSSCKLFCEQLRYKVDLLPAWDGWNAGATQEHPSLPKYTPTLILHSPVLLPPPPRIPHPPGVERLAVVLGQHKDLWVGNKGRRAHRCEAQSAHRVERAGQEGAAKEGRAKVRQACKCAGRPHSAELRISPTRTAKAKHVHATTNLKAVLHTHLLSKAERGSESFASITHLTYLT
eukprot:720428-Pelagomonas_calceolata.AAC.3